MRLKGGWKTAEKPSPPGKVARPQAVTKEGQYKPEYSTAFGEFVRP